MILSFLLFFLVLMRKIPTFDKAITYAHAHRLFLRAVALRDVAQMAAIDTWRNRIKI